MYRISLGLVSLLLSVQLVARNLDLLPDPDAAATTRRVAACEAVSLEAALLARGAASPAAAAEFARAVARRHPDLLSIGVRDAAGDLILDTGGHDDHWGGYADARSTPKHLRVDVLQDDGTLWGRVEACFRPLPFAGWWRYAGGPLLPLLAFVWAASLVVTSLYLRAVFRRVDLAQAKVVPDRVRATLNTLAEGVLVLDKHAVIALANDAFARSVGSTPDELRGRRVADLPWYDGTAELDPAGHPWASVLRDSAPRMGRLIGLRVGGDRVTLSVNATPILGDDGRCRGALTTFDDLTPVEKARAAAEAANAAKGAFLANVSHEIRTPMNAVLGMTEVVLDGGRLDTEQRECLGIVVESATSLLDVINDLLDLSKIEAGRFDLDPVEFDLRTVLDDTLQALALRAHKKGLELACDIDPGVPDAVVGDPTRLRQVVVNLVGNAVKFTEQGEVTVRVEADPLPPGAARLRLTVTDTGIGIPADKLRAIFEPFTQADGTTRRFGGTGLGLTISSHLAGLMGGTIRAESKPGGGSTFHFNALVGVPARVHATQFADTWLPTGRPILVAAGNATLRHILADMLRQLGLAPTVVDEPAVGLAELERAAAAGEPYPILLADAGLAGAAGFDLVEEASRRRLAGAAVMLLSTADLARDAERCRVAGAVAYLRKPIRRGELIRILRRTAGLPEADGATATPEPQAAAPAAGGLRVLVVEDNAFNQKVAELKLRRCGHHAHVVGGGREALAALAEGHYDLLLTDVQMPGMNGYELTAAIRAREAGGPRRTPVVAMTAHAMSGVREQCLAAGMDDYVSKPVRDEDLLAAIGRACPNSVAGRVIVAPPAAAPAASLSAIIRRVGGDREALREMVEIFYQDCNALMGDLRRSVQLGDAPGVRAAAHTLKGMTAFFESPGATAAAAELEQAGARGDLNGAQQNAAVLAGELSRIEVVLGEGMPSPPAGWHLGRASFAHADSPGLVVAG